MISRMTLNDQAKKAIALFRELELEGLNRIQWNSIISEFSQLGINVEVYNFFNEMQSLRIFPSLNL